MSKQINQCILILFKLENKKSKFLNNPLQIDKKALRIYFYCVTLQRLFQYTIYQNLNESR